MTTYLIRRLIQGFFVLVVASFVIYSILIITPGGPMDQINEIRQDPSKHVSKYFIDQMLQRYKLDKPYPLNYLVWLFDPSETSEIQGIDTVVPKGIDVTIGPWRIRGSGVLTGDFGKSVNMAKGVPVMDMIGSRIGFTLALTITALTISLLIALPIGIISAIRQYSRMDYAVTAFSFVGLSMPTFWLGLMLIIFLAVLPKLWHQQNGWIWLPYLPPGYIADTGQEGNVANRVYHLVLPVAVLAFVSIAGYSRFVRSSMLEVLRQDYVRTAWAKGLSQRVVILRHALRNALIPVITIVTLSLPGLVAGAIVTETVFSYAGMGQLFAKSVFQLDIPIVMAFLVIITTMIVISNILADVLYAVTDPRIRYS
ncbi:MAG: ABC transporter permease [Chloroflexia bacterium]